MDPRGRAARPVEDPLGALRTLAERAGQDLPHLFAARRHTAARVAAAQRDLGASCPGDRVSAVVFGSWAREELTEGSDDDWAIIYRRPLSARSPEVMTALQAARAELGAGDRAPGKQEVFGEPFPVLRLSREIGLEADSNRNFTRRMLVLLESRKLAGGALAPTRREILERYLNYAARAHQPPRFLLNDIMRYWRTLGVDFEGKHRDTKGDDPKWVLRNAKLRTARKMLFAGGLLPALLSAHAPAGSTAAFLETWLQAPASDRVAAAFLAYDAVPEGARAFAAYDRWLAIQQDPELRQALARLTFDTRDASPVFGEVRRIGREFERGLLALLFDTSLQRLARRFLVF
jgi:hypothetical protein